eukprot:scaffold4009_cov124-Cylindrotheca_fusiformis.AAC.17
MLRKKIAFAFLVSVQRQLLVIGWLFPHHRQSSNIVCFSEAPQNEEGWLASEDLEVLQGDVFDEDEEADWIPDAEKAKKKPKHLTPANEVIKPKSKANTAESERPSPYTEDEEEIINAMGGRTKNRKREDGFLGDCTLAEIATDYSVPICYLADVMCMWGVPVPINIHDRLGDMVTGEQAFALVEAVNSLDVGALQDRYSNQNLIQVCDEWEIDIKDAFAFAVKEGWSLPFGVRTNLRVEQEDELLRIFSRLYQE